MTNELIEFDRRRRMPLKVNGTNGAELSPGRDFGPRLSIRHLLVPYDGSLLAESIAPFVAMACRAFGARVTILRVLETGRTEGVPVDALEWEMARAEALANLNAFANQLETSGCKAAVEIVQGRPAEQIAHFATREGVDLIALSSHGAGGLRPWHLASTAYKVIETTNASLLVVPARMEPAKERDLHPLRRILVPLDCSQRAEAILPAASEIARVLDAELILAHVVPEPEMPRRLPPSPDDLQLAEKLTDRNRREATHYLQEMQSRLANANTRVDTRLVVSPHVGQALRQITRDEQIDLVIVSAHGRSGDPRQHYGGLAASFLNESEAPVLVFQDLPGTMAPENTTSLERAGH